MKNKNLAKVVVFKVICCGALFFFLFGGLSLFAGLSTGNTILSILGVVIVLWGTHKVSMIAFTKYNKEDE